MVAILVRCSHFCVLTIATLWYFPAWNDSRVFNSYEKRGSKQWVPWTKFSGKNEWTASINEIEHHGKSNHIIYIFVPIRCIDDWTMLFTLILIDVFHTYGKQIEHNFAEQNRSKYFVWRCGGRCRYTAPYFGFVWVNDEGRPDLIDESTMLPTKEPGSGDLMWIDGADCEHQFELAGDPEEMKKHVDHWQCILNFNKFISEKRIRVKTKKLHLTDVNDNNSFELKFHKDAEVAALPIANEFYVNFNRSTMQFVNVDSCLTVDTANSLDANSSTVCMICLCQIVESKEAVLQHLEECTGVKFKFDSDKESLPMFKIVWCFFFSFYRVFEFKLILSAEIIKIWIKSISTKHLAHFLRFNQLYTL